MDCLICKDLARTFQLKCDLYNAARAAAYYRISTEVAAIKNVDMERARSAFEDHRRICLAVAKPHSQRS